MKLFKEYFFSNLFAVIVRSESTKSLSDGAIHVFTCLAKAYLSRMHKTAWIATPAFANASAGLAMTNHRLSLLTHPP